MVPGEGRTCEGGRNMHQKLFDGKRLVKEPIWIDRDALCRQTDERVTRHDAELVLDRQDLLNQVMAVDAGMLILRRDQLKFWRWQKQIGDQKIDGGPRCGVAMPSPRNYPRPPAPDTRHSSGLSYRLSG